MPVYSSMTFWQEGQPSRWRWNKTALPAGKVPNTKSKASGWASSMSRSESIVVPSQAGQLGPQRVCCLGRPGFDGADRDAEAPGDLGVGTAVPDQAHHISVDRRELVEGLVDGEDRERLGDGVVLGRQLEVLDGQQRPGRRAPGNVVG